jgi:hypothetical protein
MKTIMVKIPDNIYRLWRIALATNSTTGQDALEKLVMEYIQRKDDKE